jgi:hypothetical protein
MAHRAASLGSVLDTILHTNVMTTYHIQHTNTHTQNIITAHAKTQMQTHEADSMSLRVYYSTMDRQNVSQGRQRFIQIRVRLLEDSRQDQDRQKGQNWED